MTAMPMPPLYVQYAILFLAYGMLLFNAIRYFRGNTRGIISNVAALLGASVLPIALILALMHWRIHDIFYASPLMFLSWIIWAVALIRGERAAQMRPSEW